MPSSATRTIATRSEAPEVGDAAVLKATGKDWDAWVRLLNRAGAAKLSHKEIAALLHDSHGVSPWWSQTVTVGYERLTGRREKHQVTGGYSASVTRTLAIAADACEKAWRDARTRKAWLPEKITIRLSTTPGVLRFAWPDGSDVEVRLTPKGTAKMQVAVQARKLKSAEHVATTKALWAERLASLAASMA